MSDHDVVKRDRAALCAMLDAALSRAGSRPTAMVDFGLPRLSTEAELMAKALFVSRMLPPKPERVARKQRRMRLVCA